MTIDDITILNLMSQAFDEGYDGYVEQMDEICNQLYLESTNKYFGFLVPVPMTYGPIWTLSNSIHARYERFQFE